MKACAKDVDIMSYMAKKSVRNYTALTKFVSKHVSTPKTPRIIPLSSINLEEKHIGMGAFNKVYRGIYRTEVSKRKKLIAYKTTKDKGTMSKKFHASLEDEAKCLYSLNHKNIVKLIGISMDDNGLKRGLVLEYCEGGTLDEFTHEKRGIVNYYILVNFLKQIAGAMTYINRTITHGDLKLMNIFIKQKMCDHDLHNPIKSCKKCLGIDAMKFTLKIGDFGCSRSIESSTSFGNNTGPYAAYETLSEGITTTASDVYSFTVIMWEMLTCEKPFNGFDMLGLLRKWIDLKPQDTILEFPVCPVPLKKLIVRGLNRDPTLRPTFYEIKNVLKIFQNDLRLDNKKQQKNFHYIVRRY
uniref:Protein kinase domain-containing protein n=1 Tax=Rhabditophanes sp. KR3021 TaxID=114890 RepID=A0AC35TQ44_9BILA